MRNAATCRGGRSCRWIPARPAASWWPSWKDVCKAFGERVVVDRLSCTFLRGDKVGLIGPNGAGKTTLLKLILGELQPDSGSVRTGARLSVAFFDQLRAGLNLDASLVDTISPGSEWVEIAGQRQHVMTYLQNFLFAPARANSPVRTLSGGERNRLLLARLFARPANVLVLDEPTNDLDIETLDLLEELLIDYPGTVFLVSHDRRFLDRVVTSTLVAEGGGRWLEYEGGVSDWLAQSARAAAAASAAAAVAARSERKAEAACAWLRPWWRRRRAGASATRSSASSTPCPRASRRWRPSRPSCMG
jgi:ATP-binding cassette subfamily F protein uup